MNPPQFDWIARIRSLSLEDMRRFAGGLAHQMTRLDLSTYDLIHLQRYYYQAALSYTLTHAQQISEVAVQAKPNYFFRMFPYGTSGLSPQTVSRVSDLMAEALMSQEAVAPETLQSLGLTPQDFSLVLGLLPGQHQWNDLYGVQYRHLDPRGMWHAVVLFDNPRGEDLQLHLMYREAELYGFTLGLGVSSEWEGAGAPTLPLSLQEIGRFNCIPREFLSRLQPREVSV